MSAGPKDERLARLNGLSNCLFGEATEVGPAEAVEMLQAAGIDPARLKAALYGKALARSAQYSKAGEPLPPLLRQALFDLRPDSGGDEATVAQAARLAIARLLEEIRALPIRPEAGFAPMFMAAYRNRKDLSVGDKKVLDGLVNDIRGSASGSGKDMKVRQDRRKWPRPGEPSPSDRSKPSRGPVYARALLAELPQHYGGIRAIAAALELSLREVEAEGFDGALVRTQDLPLGAVVVRASIREAGRKNFTIAHEIGHFVLPGHDHASLACTASDVANWADASVEREMEREADEFAAELLMPASLLEALVRGSPPSLDLIEKIAREAGASLSAAAWRYCDLAEAKCAVVWSTEGAIQWAKRSAGFPFFLPKGQPVQAGTFAAACFRQAKVPGRPRALPAPLWIGAANLDPSARLLEQSKALPAYRSVISLLWIEDGQAVQKNR